MKYPTSTRYRLPQDTPRPIRQLLERVVPHIHRIIGRNLIGIYLHGSLAMGSFQLRSSDIDMILVVQKEACKTTRKRIIQYLDAVRSGDASIEISVFSEEVLRRPKYPIKVNLRYDYPDNIFENERDKEVLAHLFETRERGFLVWGKPVREVFSAIPACWYLLASVHDLRHTRRYLLKNPSYWVLNACRTIAFNKTHRVFSKPEGGEWAGSNLPPKYHDLINRILSCHRKRTYRGRIAWNVRELKEFADYFFKAIKTQPHNQ